MRILVTGNKGFIGSHLQERLKELDHDVKGFDRDDYKYMILPDVDVVFHLAATNGTRKFYNIPYDIEYNDSKITLDIIERYRNSAKIVFASSSELYNGAFNEGLIDVPFREDSPVCFDDVFNPRSSYSIPKLLGESLLINAAHQYGTDYLVLRYFNVYGPGQKDHFVSDFIERAIEGDYTVYGNDMRSFIYIDDAIEMTIDLALNGSKHTLYNVGTDVMHPPAAVAQIILDIMGIEEKIEVKIPEGLPGSPKKRIPDTTRLHDQIMKHGKTSLYEGLKKTVQWHLEEGR